MRGVGLHSLFRTHIIGYSWELCAMQCRKSDTCVPQRPFVVRSGCCLSLHVVALLFADESQLLHEVPRDPQGCPGACRPDSYLQLLTRVQL